MRKPLRIVLLVLILSLEYQLSLGQSASFVQKRKAQATPQWIVNSQKPLHNKEVSIQKAQETNGNTTLLSVNPPHTSHREKSVNAPEYLPGKVFVKFKPAAVDAIKPFANQSQRRVAITAAATKTGLSQARVNQLESIGNQLKGTSNVYKASIDESLTTEEALEILEKLPEVEYAERIPLYHTFFEPADPAYVQGNQYALDLVHATHAFDKLDSPGEIYVAIVDDAFLYDHPDLSANVDVSKCYDVADRDTDTRPPSSGTNKAGPLTFSHGTHVAGIAGAVTDNSLGIASISNNNVKLFGIKATPDNTDEPRNIDFSLEGVRKAIENGARVINMSFGGSAPSKAWQDMINEATAKGVVFVAAAGNGNTSAKNFPAAFDNVIAVANTNHRDIKDPLSHYGTWVDIAAPGTDIYSTVVGSDGTSGTYTFYSGTSMAAPMVAGLVGLMLSQNEALGYNEIVSILKNTADNIDATNTGYEGRLGAGRINAYNAILAAKNIVDLPEARIVASDQEIYTSQAITFSSQSLGNGLSYKWTFDGGTPASSVNGASLSLTYNTPGTYQVSLQVTNSTGFDMATLQHPIVVRDPMDCEILAFPFPGTRSLYNYTDNDTKESLGPVVGQNEYKATQFANKYEYLPGYYISGGLFAINKAISRNMERAKVTFKVWEKVSMRDIPGKVLVAQEVAYKDLVFTKYQNDKNDRGTYTEVVFDNPPKVPEDGNFFLGFEIYHVAGDTVVFYTNENGENNGNDAYFFSEEGWEAFSPGFDANIEISPVLMGEGFLKVAPFVAESGTCVGGTIDFTAEAIQNAVGYNWYFEGGNPLTSTEANPTVTYPTMGEFEAVLLVTLQGCSVGRSKVIKKVRIVDCNQAPEADFGVDRYILAAGDSVRFFEASSSATDYSWTFEGGAPLTSGIANPYVVYSNPGIYEVRLEVQNPDADIASLVKEDYITVLEPDACDFYPEITFNSPPAGSPTLYYSDDGYIAGTNNAGDLGKATYFKGISSRAYLNKLELYFGAAHASMAHSEAEVVVYDDNGFNGGPGDLIASRKIRISDIEEDVDQERATVVYFDDLAIKGPFYAGISLDLKYEHDTVALISSRDDEAGGGAWDQSATGAWTPTNENWQSSASNPLDIALHISAFMTKVNLFSAPDCTPLGVNEQEGGKKAIVSVFPNPFDNQTNIEYLLTQGGWVRLEIYNSLGRKVATLTDEYQTIGQHVAIFEASTQASGLYIYRLSLGGKPISSGRLVLR